ncbi:MAG: hypothetical protein HYX27_22500 [Acidobacteria bacterium]|nr:hypothetical protein [Acidobacteriota bacterium]
MSKPSSAAINQEADLSPDARQAIETRKITGAWNARALVKLLGELERWDLTIEKRKSKANGIWIGSIVATVLGFFLMFFVGAVTDSLWMAPIPFVVPLASIFYFRRKLNELTKADIPNELRLAIRPMLKQLSQDFHPDQKVRVDLNLTMLDEKQRKFSKNLPPGKNRSLKLSVFEAAVCDMRMPLADGSTAVLRVDNEYHKLERSYKTPRGKYKSKTKWKKATTATAILIPAAPMKWEPARMQKFIEKSCEKLSFSEKNGVMVARLDRYYKFKSAGQPPQDTLPPADIVRLFIRLTGMRPTAAGGGQ